MHYLIDLLNNAMSDNQNMEEAILNAATKLFLEKGFKSTSTTEIAKKAGCNQALVHYYYRTKDRLFEAIFQNKVKFFIGALLGVENENLPYQEKLANKIESHFEAIKTDPKLPLFFFNELSTNPKRIEAIKTSIGDLPDLAFSKMDSELQVEIKKGAVRPIEIRDLLMTIVSLNLFVFIGEPMFKIMTKQSDEAYSKFLEHRKKENVRIVLNSLKPDSDL